MKSDKKFKIEIFPTANAVNNAAAKFITDVADKAISARGQFTIALSGGHTPEKLYSLLSKPSFHNQINWSKTYVFWGDERYVPANDSRNNANMAKTLFLDRIDIPTKNINPVHTDFPPEKAALEYEETIKKFFGKEAPRFDLILLGLGENGHTASLFPRSKVLAEHEKLVSETYIEEQKMFRITMTEKLINQAYNIIFLVEGKAKAEILNTIINGDYHPDKYPAQSIRPLNGNLYWFVDHSVASFLQGNNLADKILQH